MSQFWPFVIAGLTTGSLYGLALGAPRFLWPATPIGGLVLMLGWLCVVAAGWTKEPGPA